MKQRLVGEGFTLIPFTGENKNGISFTRKTQCVNELRAKAGIANSLSVRCARACPFARTEVRMRKQWAT